MMKNKIVSVCMFLFGLAVFDANGQVSPMDRFRDSAVLLLNGISSSDRVALTDASEGFGGIAVSEFEDFTVTQTPADALSAPVIIFSSEYCDLLRKNNFETVRLDALDMMRAQGDGDIVTVTRSIAPAGKAVFTFSGEDEVAVLMASPDLSALSVTVSVDGFKKVPEKDGNGFTASSSVSLGTGGAEFNVEVDNTSDQLVSFVIALQ